MIREDPNTSRLVAFLEFRFLNTDFKTYKFN